MNLAVEEEVDLDRTQRSARLAVAVVVATLALGGCAAMTGAAREDAGLPAVSSTGTEVPATNVVPDATPATSDAAPAAMARGADANDVATPVLAQATTNSVEEPAQYDPWEPFNEKMFEFNRQLDRWVLKPVAKAYNAVLADELQVAIGNAFTNIAFVPRAVNSLLQGKWQGAGREVARFVINSTMGFGGLFDTAKDYIGLRKSDEDFGQTLAVWGSGPGPYLVLPFMAPMTVRDGIGRAVDGAMDPLSYLIPFIPERLVLKVADTVNDRSLNLQLFEGVEETTIDLYSSVRHFYLTRRTRQIAE